MRMLSLIERQKRRTLKPNDSRFSRLKERRAAGTRCLLPPLLHSVAESAFVGRKFYVSSLLPRANRTPEFIERKKLDAVKFVA